MQTIVRNAIARIDVMQQGRPISRGTGFLVADGLVLTALHVVADRKQQTLTPYPGEIVLTFPTGTTKASIYQSYWDRMADWALLRCETPPEARPLPLAQLTEDGAPWETYGFPDANPRDGMVSIGAVSNHLGTLEGNSVIQLFSREAAAGQGAPVKGLSGSPVLVQNAIVGLLRFALMKEGQTVAGTVYACPITAVLEKAGNLLPLPDRLGLPGLPRQPLPPEPFRHLDWFTEKEAEVFFGRDREIRLMYDRLTTEDAPPILLLYGQAGVGKSSFLNAGLLPRLRRYHQVCYLRRDPRNTLVATLRENLKVLGGEQAASADSLAAAWRAVEQNDGKPLVVFFDQIEELYTHSNSAIPRELKELSIELGSLFDGTVPLRGRLVLSFRKEWFPEIQKEIEVGGLSYTKVFLEGLDREAVLEAINGLTLTDRLRQFYGLTIEPGLASIIADDLLEDRDSPIAPTLQILLTKMWRKATALSRGAPLMTRDLYQTLKKEGVLLGDFLDQQLATLRSNHPEWVDSGLALDVLSFHTTPLLTAKERSREELLTTYQHRAAEIPTVVQEMQKLFLLSDPSRDDERLATRLCHDTLTPLVRDRCDHSDKPGQRARRIVESRVDDWDESDENALDAASLVVVERGIAGMRALSVREEQLLASSRRKRVKEGSVRRILQSAAAAAGVLISVLTVVLYFAYSRANDQHVLADLERKAAIVKIWLPLRPLNALLYAIAAAADSMETRKSVLPSVESALSTAALESLESNRVERENMRASAISPDGSTVATCRVIPGDRDLQEIVEFWDRKLTFTGSLSRPVPWALGPWDRAALAFSPDGNLLAVGGATLTVWDRRQQPPSDAFRGTWTRDLSQVKSVAFTPDGNYVLSGHNDGTLRVWTPNGQLVAKIPADDAIEPASTLFPRFRQIPLPAFVLAAQRHPQPGSVNAVAALRGLNNETVVATGGQDGSSRLWRLDNGTPVLILKTLLDPRSPILSIAMAIRKDKLLVAAGAKNGSLRILDQTGKGNEPYYFHDPVDAVTFSPNSDIIAAATDYGEVRLLDLTGAEIGPAFRGFSGPVHSLEFFPDGLHLAATGYAGTILIDTTRLAGGRDIRALIPFVADPGNPVVGAAFIKGQALVAGTESGDLLFWHPETDFVSRSDHAQGGNLKILAANRQGSMIAGGGSDGRIRLFDAAGKILGDLTPPTGPNWELAEPSWGNPGASVVFSPEGKTLATQHSNQEVILWDLASRRRHAIIHRMDIHGKDVQGKEAIGYPTAPMAFTASGDRLATVFGKSLRFWHLDGTADSSPPLQLGQMVVNLAFRPDGKGFVTIEPGNIVRRWTMSGHEVKPVNTCCNGLFAQWIAVDDKSERILALTTGSTGLGGGVDISIGTYPTGENSEIESKENYAVPFIFRSVALSPEADAIVTVDDVGVRLWPVGWRAALKESCERLRGHSVFQNPNYASGLDPDAIRRAQTACQAELWKK